MATGLGHGTGRVPVDHVRRTYARGPGSKHNESVISFKYTSQKDPITNKISFIFIDISTIDNTQHAHFFKTRYYCTICTLPSRLPGT